MDIENNKHYIGLISGVLIVLLTSSVYCLYFFYYRSFYSFYSLSESFIEFQIIKAVPVTVLFVIINLFSFWYGFVAHKLLGIKGYLFFATLIMIMVILPVFLNEETLVYFSIAISFFIFAVVLFGIRYIITSILYKLRKNGYISDELNKKMKIFNPLFFTFTLVLFEIFFVQLSGFADAQNKKEYLVFADQEKEYIVIDQNSNGFITAEIQDKQVQFISLLSYSAISDRRINLQEKEIGYLEPSSANSYTLISTWGKLTNIYLKRGYNILGDFFDRDYSNFK